MFLREIKSQINDSGVPRPKSSTVTTIQNRAKSMTDQAAISLWLQKKTEGTQKAYLPHSKALLLFLELNSISLSVLSYSDLLSVIEAAPTPNARWYRYTVYKSLFGFLKNVGYIDINPCAAISQEKPRKKRSSKLIDRASILSAQTCYEYNDRADAQTRFSIMSHYLLAARIHELVSHPWCSIQKMDGRWYWFALGKGRNKEAERSRTSDDYREYGDAVPVTDTLLDEMMRYRRSLGLPMLPNSRETLPILSSIKGTRSISCRRAFEIIKSGFECVASAPNADARLLVASPHWLRHSRITHLVHQKVDPIMVQAFARHSNIDTTRIYINELEGRLSDAVQQADR